MIELAENRYGKSRIRLMKVTRNDDSHDLREWTVQVLLKGDFDSAHLHGDNSKILPTDTMKNTVYSIARNSKAIAMEDYAKELADFLLERNPQVASAFMRGSDELQIATVERAQNEAFRVHSGLDNLVLLKTANSSFEGYIKDSLTTLKETNDRLLGTAMRAEWHYTTPNLDHNAIRSTLREAMLRTFAEHDSKSVQQTLYAMAKSALEATPEIDDIEITMPNKHCLLVDLSRFNQDNPNEIFVPTDEPHGYIEARVRRTP